MYKYWFLFALAILLAACGGQAEPVAEVVEVPTETAVLPTETPVPPTETPAPTNTPVPPTETPIPTNTPIPPTNTPIPPTNTPEPTPEPIFLTGTGDSLVDIEKTDAPALVRIEGNAAGRFFAVKNYDAAGDDIGLLVNTTDPYVGVRPLDFRNDEHTAGFEVQADGEWTIEVLPLGAIPHPEGMSYEGEGDSVFSVANIDATKVTIVGNADGRFFAVKAYSSSVDLLVNTTDPYEGTVRFDNDTIIIEVEARGAWSVTFE